MLKSLFWVHMLQPACTPTHTRTIYVPGNSRVDSDFEWASNEMNLPRILHSQIEMVRYHLNWCRTMPLLKHNQLGVWIVVRSNTDNLHHTLIVCHAILQRRWLFVYHTPQMQGVIMIMLRASQLNWRQSITWNRTGWNEWAGRQIEALPLFLYFY